MKVAQGGDDLTGIFETHDGFYYIGIMENKCLINSYMPVIYFHAMISLFSFYTSFIYEEWNFPKYCFF